MRYMPGPLQTVGYCVKCKMHRRMGDLKAVTIFGDGRPPSEVLPDYEPLRAGDNDHPGKGRPATEGTCSICGTIIYRMMDSFPSGTITAG